MSPEDFQAPAGAFFILISSGGYAVFENILIMIFLNYGGGRVIHTVMQDISNYLIRVVLDLIGFQGVSEYEKLLDSVNSETYIHVVQTRQI